MCEPWRNLPVRGYDQHYKAIGPAHREGTMSFLAWFFTVFFVLAFIVGPIVGPEDRPHMKRPDDKSIRPPVGSWFGTWRR
jgi:hypothetical protein